VPDGEYISTAQMIEEFSDQLRIDLIDYLLKYGFDLRTDCTHTYTHTFMYLYIPINTCTYIMHVYEAYNYCDLRCVCYLVYIL
jgi:hypothetical protein